MWKTIDTAPIAKSLREQILVGFRGQFEWIYFIAIPYGKDTSAPGYAKPTHWYDSLPAPPEGVEFVSSTYDIHK